MLLRLLLLLVIAVTTSCGVPTESNTQCVIGIADNWSSSKVSLSAYEKRDGKWTRVLGPWPGRLGERGLAWGRGLHSVPTGAIMMREGDSKSPAGVFAIGGAWGYHASIRKHPRLSYRQVTTRDCWVDDPKSASYNQHLILDSEPSTPWEKRQQMKQGDHAHSLKLFIAHNAPPKVEPGGGSAIFFHIWRNGGSTPTAGCTTLSEDRLRTLIAWIDPDQNPIYVLTPKSEYPALAETWDLP